MIKFFKIPKDRPYYFLVSMGIDSLSAFMFMRSKGFKLIPVHINHNLRPQNDDMNWAFEHFFRKLGYISICDCEVSGKTVNEVTNHSNVYISDDFVNRDTTILSPVVTSEAGCREYRHQIMQAISNIFPERKSTRDVFITAHHRDDWIESYLMNCFRGQPDNDAIPVASDFKDYVVVHPFLLTKKRDFIQYAERTNVIDMCGNDNDAEKFIHGLGIDHDEKISTKLIDYVVSDETNDIIKGSRRNWVRHEIIPLMRKQEVSLDQFALRKIYYKSELIDWGSVFISHSDQLSG